MIRDLQEKAIRLGATSAKVIAVSSIVIDDRVRLKCLVPLCDHYNQNRMCPPHLPPMEVIRKCLKRYSKALFVQTVLKKEGRVSQAEARSSGLRLHQIINALESEAFSSGFPLAAGLIGGSCKLCRRCAGPSRPCRHPMKARPSMEGMGIDVFHTARKIGLPFRFPARQGLVWNGLLLIK